MQQAGEAREDCNTRQQGCSRATMRDNGASWSQAYLCMTNTGDIGAGVWCLRTCSSLTAQDRLCKDRAHVHPKCNSQDQPPGWTCTSSAQLPFLNAMELPSSRTASRQQAGSHLGQELPGVGDGLLLEVVPKRPVAQHLEEGVVVHIFAHIVQVVVLATGPDALRPSTSMRIACQKQQQMALPWQSETVQRSLLTPVVPHPARAAQIGVLGLCPDAHPMRACQGLAATGAAWTCMHPGWGLTQQMSPLLGRCLVPAQGPDGVQACRMCRFAG